MAFVALTLTLVTKDWIEMVFSVDPDRHSGGLEWVIVAVAFAVMVTSSTLARREWLRAAAARSEAR
jgi:hypothetical protein